MTETHIEHFIGIFNIGTDLTDVKFNQINIRLYKPPARNGDHKAFGEDMCSLCTTHFTTFNIGFSLKILFFVYESYAEVLKLEIHIDNEHLAKEIAACKNFLQRKRNMNLTFEILIKFAKLFESRRLILNIVIKKQPYVTVQSADNEGYAIKCFSNEFNKLLVVINWALKWQVDSFEVADNVDFYCNNEILDQAKMIKFKMLVQPLFDFHIKLKLWKLLMKDLYNSDSAIFTIDLTEEQVLELPDSDSEDDKSVVEVKEEVIVL